MKNKSAIAFDLNADEARICFATQRQYDRLRSSDLRGEIHAKFDLVTVWAPVTDLSTAQPWDFVAELTVARRSAVGCQSVRYDAIQAAREFCRDRIESINLALKFERLN